MSYELVEKNDDGWVRNISSLKFFVGVKLFDLRALLSKNTQVGDLRTLRDASKMLASLLPQKILKK
jgi:hypothetical protein